MGNRLLTNKFGLPETLVKAVELDTHVTKGDISCTTLIDGPQIRILKRDNDYEVDVVDQLYALMGTALHHILERANISDVRRRAFITTAETIMTAADNVANEFTDKAQQLRNGANWIFSLIPVMFPEIGNRYMFEITTTLDMGARKISCTFDLYDREKETLYDYKFCSVFSWMIPESRMKWDEQLNIYALALETVHQLPVKRIRIVAFFRDWNRHGYQRDRDYPDRQIKEIDIRIRPKEKIIALINYHMDLHVRADNGENIECSGAVRWAEADQYAVILEGAKRASRVFDVKADAERYITENQAGNKKKLTLNYWPGGSRRCENYCSVSSLCPQYKKELEMQKTETDGSRDNIPNN